MPNLESHVFIPKRGPGGSPILDSFGRPVMAVGTNPLKESIEGFHLVPKQGAITLAGSASDELEFIIDSQGHFDWTHIVGQSTAAYTLEFVDPGGQDRLMNFPAHSGTIVGTARRPFKLPEPYLFNVEDRERRFIAKLRNLSGSPNTVRLNLYGRRYYSRDAVPDIALKVDQKLGRNFRGASYFLVPQEVDQFGVPTVLGPLASTQFIFIMDHDADADLDKLMANSTGIFSFNLREEDTNRQLSNQVIHSINGWGTAEFPFLFADTWLLERSKRLICDVTDLSGSNNTIFLTIAGRRLQLG